MTDVVVNCVIGPRTGIQLFPVTTSCIKDVFMSNVERSKLDNDRYKHGVYIKLPR